MTREEEYKRKADALLRLAADAADMRTRSSLIDRAAHWHKRAMEEHELNNAPAHGGDDATEEAHA